MEEGRWNSSCTSTITIEVFGHQLQLAQDPNSKHHGTTVWDASMVFVKYLEKNCRKGPFCFSKMKGKRAIELGAGCGLAGMGMALLGCDVILTDQIEVLPLLKRNIERNTSRILQANLDSTSLGSMHVAELDWGNQEHINVVRPPFDFIIGTDVVYAEHLLDPLQKTIVALSGPRTTIMLGYEIRSTTVHDQMIHGWKSNFKMKTVPRSKMDVKYQHPSIQLFVMEMKAQNACAVGISLDRRQENNRISEESTSNTKKSGSEIDQDAENCTLVELKDNKDQENDPGIPLGTSVKPGSWEARRYGSMAARLLKDVTIK